MSSEESNSRRIASAQRVAIWGNMNNVGFALLRYLRDLGLNAHLFAYANDGRGALSHFRPEADTWHIDRWSDFIHTLPFPDSQVSALDAPLSWALAAKSWLGNLRNKDVELLSAVSRRSLRRLVLESDVIVGSGIAPAVLERIGRPLDLFYPYATGIEYLGAYDFCSYGVAGNPIAQLVNEQVRRRQAVGVKNAATIISFEQQNTGEVLRVLGRSAFSFPLPMVYVEKERPVNPPSEISANAIKVIQESDLSILHHARLLWRRPEHVTVDDWKIEGKNSHWLFHAIARLRAIRPSVRPMLLVAEYGPDVKATRVLADELGISPFITWLPLMSRKEIMWLLDKVDIGAGEFYDCDGMIWGGTGWEVMAAGRPLLQGFKFNEGEFEDKFGYKEPPFFKVAKQEDVLRHLLRFLDDRVGAEDAGAACQEWFHTHNGRALAKKWAATLPKRNVGRETSARQVWSN